MNSPDESVRLTDYDALSSRLSCHLKGYTPNDIYILHLVPLILFYQLKTVPSEFKQFALARKLKSQFFNLFPLQSANLDSILNINPQSLFSKINRFTPLKSPMINRGTYLRTVSISDKITDFIETNSANDIQIISLGAGNDTRVFNLLPEHKNLTYFELDVMTTVKLKKLAILSSTVLSDRIGAQTIDTNLLPKSAFEIDAFDAELHTQRYHLLPIDLRTLSATTNPNSISQLASIDPSKPTLIISECCICYLTKTESNNLITFWRQWLTSGQFLIYEPLGGLPNESTGSNYGNVMVRNLICRGIEMPTLMEYGTVESQTSRFNNLLSTSSWCKSMRWVYENEVSQTEKDRLSRLEMLDELEELNLINTHYCLIIASFTNLSK